jgi:serine/threonine protein phosphatase PrpC
MESLTSGATACAILIRGSKLYIAWLGDSQASVAAFVGTGDVSDSFV